MTPEEWLILVTLLQQQGRICIAREDRKFLEEMANVLTLDDPPKPLPWQERWLWTLKRECRL